jgi:hypothetical protein
VALAVDGSRAYALRRDIQAAVDAAALAAGDKLQATGSYASAEQAATTIFGANLRLYAAPSCSPGYGAPGASPYTVTFGLVYNLAANGPVQNTDTSGCGTGAGTCTLNTTSLTAPAIILPSVPAPDPTKAPGTFGAYPPDLETSPLQLGLPNQNPNRGAPPAGDRANENNCRTTAGALASCPAPITPGAVVFYFPSGSCLNATNSGDNYVFSGYQYNWVIVYEPGPVPGPANTCANTFGADGNSAFVGLFYSPSASIAVTSPWISEAGGTGGLVADSLTFSGGLPTIT